MTNYCNSKTLLEFNQVMTSAEQLIVDEMPILNYCYDAAEPLIPATTPYIDVLDKCD